MSENLQIGVIGCGYWGPNLIRNFCSLDKCTVRFICDLDRSRLDHMATLYPNSATTTQVEDLFECEEVDAIVIATPVHLHHELGKRALLCGKHVFIEKPMASSSDECRELIELADERALTLMTGHTFVYTSVVRRIKKIIDSGDLGNVQYISARRLNLGLFQKDINVAWDLAPHDISIILYLLGEVPASVNCQGKSHIAQGIEDVTNMTLNFSSGRLATIHSSWLDPNKIRQMTVVGTRRMLLYDDLEPLEKVKIYDKRVEAPPHYDTFAEFQYSYHYGDVYSPYIKQTEPLKVECQHFLDCINERERCHSGGREGLQVVQILEASSASLRSNGNNIPIAIGDIQQVSQIEGQFAK